MRLALPALFQSRMCRRDVIAGLTGLLFGTLAGGFLIVWSGRSSPVIIRDEHEVDTASATNGFIRLFIDLDRYRDCPSETSRWLWKWVEHSGQPIRQFYPLSNSTTTLSDAGLGQRFIIVVPLPAGIDAGEYFYWSKTVAHCSLLPRLFSTPVSESGNIPIRIEAGR